MAFLHEIILHHGADSYLARCACVVYGSSETCFYLSALYFAGAKKVSPLPVLAALAGNFLAAVPGLPLLPNFVAKREGEGQFVRILQKNVHVCA